jgi:hypothetical protein
MTGWLLVGIGTVWLLLYAAACWWRPWARCLRCKGAARFYSQSRKTWRDCPRCKGSGKRIRFGRRLFSGGEI